MSLLLEEPACLSLLGPNGAGKTTTLRAITGLLDIHEGRVTRGAITFEGTSLVGRRPDEIVAMGISQVMEGRRVFGDLTVEENLLSGAWGVARGEVSAGLERTYGRFPILAERRRQAAGYLSGGEQQMLAISRALMSSPRLLLLDEPSLGLAPRIVTEVAALIREINQDGVAVLLVEQNAAVALSLAEHACIIETGKTVLAGTAAELREDADVKEFYLGQHGEGRQSYREVKHYRRRKRWLS